MQPSQIREYLSKSRQPVSLDLRVGDNKDTELLDILPDESSLSDEHIVQECLHHDMTAMLGSLTPIQQQVLTLRFGLGSEPELNLGQIGRQLNLSRERVRQIQNKAISILSRQQHAVKDYLLN